MADRTFDWDDDKSDRNYSKRGIDFETASLVFDDPAYCEAIDDRFDYGEERIRAVGMALGMLIAVIYTERYDHTRIISARPATRKEIDDYYIQGS